MKKLLMLGLIFLLGLTEIPACTTFCISHNQNIFFGRNFDFDIGNGFLAVNPRGLSKTAYLPETETPAEWVSEYGSITFNQIGVDFPMGGMNEKGLVVAQMYLREAGYPKADDRPAVGELQWIQYQMDNSATVGDVLSSLNKIRISNTSMAPLHYLICDSKGQSATVEFLDGETVVHTGNKLEQQVLGNIPYPSRTKLITNQQPFGGKKPVPAKSEGVIDNIAIANARVKSYRGEKKPVDYSFDILKAIESPGRTQWSTVFDVSAREIHFKTLNNNKIRTVKMNAFAYDCHDKWQFVYLEKSNPNEEFVSQLQEYTLKWHKAHVKDILHQYNQNLKGFPAFNEEIIRSQGLYPQNVRCKH